MNPPVNILLVDDEQRNLEVLEGILQAPELRLVRASSAEATLLALLHGEFAAIVLDIQMPDMSGIELAHLIKQRERTQHIPIIFLTALYQDERRMLESYNVGAVDYLTKPVNPNVLRSKVAVFVDLFRKTQALQRANAALQQEIKQREKAEAALRETNDALEARVEARTAALSQARDAAEQAGRAKDDFLAALSHELRTPLNPALLLASEAAGNPAFGAEAREQFAAIRKNVELEARLIDDLLDLTRITRGKLPIELRACDLHGIIEDALVTVRGEQEQKRIRLALSLDAPRHLVMGDPVRLQQVLWNVLKNAVKFTPEEGSVRVATRLDAAAETISVEITDTGIGLSPAELARVFEAFVQGDHAAGGSSHRFGGLGLGLTISRSLMELHGGTLNARSAGLGQGATFVVSLPLAAEGVERPASHQSLPPLSTRLIADGVTPPRKLKRVLLVEDHEPTRKTLEVLLQRRQYDVATSASVREARALASEQVFDLLISDIGLPDGSGFELMQELGERTGILGIALTGYGMEEDVERSRNVGFRVHLTKPINVQSLDHALAELSGLSSTVQSRI